MDKLELALIRNVQAADVVIKLFMHGKVLKRFFVAVVTLPHYPNNLNI